MNCVSSYSQEYEESFKGGCRPQTIGVHVGPTSEPYLRGAGDVPSHKWFYV